MNDREALERAILLEPGEDTPRLAYADWLDEHGDAAGRRWAESIRWMIARPENSWVCLCAAGKVCTPCRLVPGAGDIPKRTDRVGETPYVVHRGFVSEWRGTCGQFLGGPCGKCGGRGRVWPGHRAVPTTARVPCPDCRGTGTTPGLAAAIFAAHPVRVVRLVGRKPGGAHGPADRAGWYFTVGGSHTYEMPYDLPAHLLQFFEDGVGAWRVYDTARAARAALSRALVKLGRKLANLE